MKFKPISKQIADEQKRTSVSTARRHATQWFEEQYLDGKAKKNPIEPTRGKYLQEGKMYTYTYDPKYADKLDFFDNHPVMLCLGNLETKTGYNAFGLNISYIPPKVRVKVLDRIVNVFGSRVIDKNIKSIERGKNTNLLKMPLSYDIAKKILKGSGFEFAIRSYIYTRMEEKPLIISYDDWYKVAQFPSDFIRKLNAKAIYMRYKKQFSTDYTIGKKDPKVSISKVKIRDINKYINDANKK